MVTRQLVLPFGSFERGINSFLASAESQEEVEALEEILAEYWCSAGYLGEFPLSEESEE